MNLSAGTICGNRGISSFQGDTTALWFEVGALSRPQMSDPFRVGMKLQPVADESGARTDPSLSALHHPEGVRYKHSDFFRVELEFQPAAPESGVLTAPSVAAFPHPEGVRYSSEGTAVDASAVNQSRERTIPSFSQFRHLEGVRHKRFDPFRIRSGMMGTNRTYSSRYSSLCNHPEGVRYSSEGAALAATESGSINPEGVESRRLRWRNHSQESWCI